MSDEHIKHLEFIQGIIIRMAQCSFWVKGWCVTLVSAFLALYAKMGNEKMLICTIIPILTFWGLDAYFLKQERIFRELYDLVEHRNITDIIYRDLGFSKQTVAEDSAYIICFMQQRV